MKAFFTLSFISLFLLASESYERGKIDMHGGKDEYSNSGYQSGFRSGAMGMSLFLDKNSSKKSNQKEMQKKK
ncbi:hypothetical protein GJV85_01540 [Sulfurimonas aquatica]|uniref:Uncharacterized protein n=1 Tax=Sulfurimonas aquatica TaxID=2672570 RepID=A0A975GBV3_9BACT|nr:hypothetical protein [Sulfurimonas aquatica]QSZ40852.1 hypothetical protein GJV85_01540 [Sulfurimonas aquatica]